MTMVNNNRMVYGGRRSGRTVAYLDWAATQREKACMLGTMNLNIWKDYMEQKWPDVKIKVVELGIIINPRD